MQKAKHVVIIAGEESGDAHAAKLIKQLKKDHPDIYISGIGGQQMKEAGAELIYDLAQYGVTGITEVFRFLKILRKAFSEIQKHLILKKPDLLILVDYPGFNLRLAKYAKKKLGLRVFYYISPQIWAWKAKRIHLIKECIDHMAIILPFEKPIYEKAGVPVSFVGHPLTEKIPSDFNSLTQKKALKLPLDKIIIALLPGSRNNEIERHMPILQKTATLLLEKGLNAHFILPIAQTLNSEKVKSYDFNSSPITYVQNEAINCMIAADFVIVASGTASLECALLKKPMCIIYKSSFLTYLCAMSLIKVKFLGLCNLLMKKMIVPEFLQYDCNAPELAHYIFSFFSNAEQGQIMTKQLTQLHNLLSSNQSDCSLLQLVKAELKLEINAESNINSTVLLSRPN